MAHPATRSLKADDDFRLRFTSKRGRGLPKPNRVPFPRRKAAAIAFEPA